MFVQLSPAGTRDPPAMYAGGLRPKASACRSVQPPALGLIVQRAAADGTGQSQARYPAPPANGFPTNGKAFPLRVASPQLFFRQNELFSCINN